MGINYKLAQVYYEERNGGFIAHQNLLWQQTPKKGGAQHRASLLFWSSFPHLGNKCGVRAQETIAPVILIIFCRSPYFQDNRKLTTVWNQQALNVLTKLCLSIRCHVLTARRQSVLSVIAAFSPPHLVLSAPKEDCDHTDPCDVCFQSRPLVVSLLIDCEHLEGKTLVGSSSI